MKTHEGVPLEEVGVFVQKQLAEGAIAIVVTRNPDGRTCTVSVQHE
jgi:hypothetical protein